MIDERELLEHALIGYESRLKELEEQVARISAQIAPHRAGTTRVAPAGIARNFSLPEPALRRRRKRALSEEARAKMAKAQKKRWAAWRRKNGIRPPRKKAA